jgi:D-aminopeptidase
MTKSEIKQILSTKLSLYPTGPLNKISDVYGVTVGHYTQSSATQNTGITIIKPTPDNNFQQKIPAAMYVGNAFGKFVGSTQIQELGNIETMIGLTNTLAVNDVATFIKDHTKEQNPAAFSINPVVGEVNDMRLNNIRDTKFSYDNFLSALNDAKADFDEGAVGAGRGGYCFGFKGGIGSSSRVVKAKLSGLDRDYTVGALILTNFGGMLNVLGYPVGYLDKKYPLAEKFADDKGSCIIVVATDAPLLPNQLTRMAKRAFLALGWSGSIFSNGSGDYALAFSTANSMQHDGNKQAQMNYIPNDLMTYFFWSTLEAVQTATYSAMLHAETVSKDNYTLEALDFESILSKLPY